MMAPCDPGAGVVLYSVRRLLLVLHGGASVVLIGSSTHHALQMRHYLRGRFSRQPAERTQAVIVSASYVATFILGALLYPTYRVHVRGYYLDRYAPGYANLFDVKEVYASLTLVVAVALGVLALNLRPADNRTMVRIYAAMSFIICAVTWFNVVSGLLITSVRGIG